MLHQISRFSKYAFYCFHVCLRNICTYLSSKYTRSCAKRNGLYKKHYLMTSDIFRISTKHLKSALASLIIVQQNLISYTPLSHPTRLFFEKITYLNIYSINSIIDFYYGIYVQAGFFQNYTLLFYPTRLFFSKIFLPTYIFIPAYTVIRHAKVMQYSEIKKKYSLSRKIRTTQIIFFLPFFSFFSNFNFGKKIQ